MEAPAVNTKVYVYDREIEVDNYCTPRFAPLRAALEQAAREPEAFTPWFLMEWQALRGQYAEQLALYL